MGGRRALATFMEVQPTVVHVELELLAGREAAQEAGVDPKDVLVDRNRLLLFLVLALNLGATLLRSRLRRLGLAGRHVRVADHGQGLVERGLDLPFQAHLDEDADLQTQPERGPGFWPGAGRV